MKVGGHHHHNNNHLHIHQPSPINITTIIVTIAIVVAHPFKCYNNIIEINPSSFFLLCFIIILSQRIIILCVCMCMQQHVKISSLSFFWFQNTILVCVCFDPYCVLCSPFKCCNNAIKVSYPWLFLYYGQ